MGTPKRPNQHRPLNTGQTARKGGGMRSTYLSSGRTLAAGGGKISTRGPARTGASDLLLCPLTPH